MNFKNAVSKAAIVARQMKNAGKLSDSDIEAFIRAYTRAHLKGQRKGWNQEKIARRAKARFGSLKAARLVLAIAGASNPALKKGGDVITNVVDLLIERGKA